MTNQKIILDWMAKNPNRLLRTNCKLLASSMLLDKDSKLKMTTGSCIQLLQRMLRDNLILREGGKFRGDFKINYGHPDLPKGFNKEIKVTKPKTKAKTKATPVEPPKPRELEAYVNNPLGNTMPSVIVDDTNGEIKLSITINLNLNK